MKAYDLYCGLGGWAEGFLAEGYEMIGFDIEAHDYGTGGYPGTLILRDVRSIHGSELKEATCIVASPPCQAYSYRAMPWKRAKSLPPPDNTLFNECFRIQGEASAAAGHHIPLIVENVRGAQKWVGRAQWHYGSFYLWGDVPALMPITFAGHKNPIGAEPVSVGEFAWNKRVDFQAMRKEGVKGFTPNGEPLRRNILGRAHGSKSEKRKAASSLIAKIPFPLANYIAKHFKESASDLLREEVSA